MFRMICSVCIGVGLLSLAGCLCSSSHVTFNPSDPAIAQSTASQIKLGETTKDQLIALLGTPSSQSVDGKGVETLRYIYEMQKNTSFYFLIVNISDEKKEQLELLYEVKDGIVTNAWRKP